MQLFYTYHSLNSDIYNWRVHNEFLQQQQKPAKSNDRNRATQEKKAFRFRYLFSPILLQNCFGVSPEYQMHGDTTLLQYNWMESQKT